MASIVYLKNRKSGKVYAYLNESVWDKEKKKCVCKRKCIGHLDPVTGEIVPNRSRREKEAASVKSVGFSIIFEQICERIGLSESLRVATPKNWKKILACAQYILERGNTLSRCGHWAEETLSVSDEALDPKSLQTLFSELTADVRQRFFEDWIGRNGETDMEAVNFASIASVAGAREKVMGAPDASGDFSKLGLCVFIGSKKRLPLYIKQVPCGPMNAKSLSKVVERNAWVKPNRVCLVIDRDFCDDDSLEYLYRKRNRFIARTYPEFDFSRESIQRVKGGIMAMENLTTIKGRQFFTMSFLSHWRKHRCYSHIFFDSFDAESEFGAFLGLVEDCRRELESGETVKEHEYFYKKYFLIGDGPGGREVDLNSDAVMAYNEVAGFSVLLSSHVKDPVDMMYTFQEKERMERMFDDIRNEEDSTLLKLYVENAFDCRVFLQFIALVVSCEIQRTLQKRPELSGHTMMDVIEEASKIKRIRIPGQKKPSHTKVSRNQMEIMGEFGIDFLFAMAED